MSRTQALPKTGSIDTEILARSEEFSLIAKRLEPEHFGKYVMINVQSGAYVLASTISDVHHKFIERFGAETAGYCLRIGASPFAAA
jgi:hypothetical protein